MHACDQARRQCHGDLVDSFRRADRIKVTVDQKYGAASVCQAGTVVHRVPLMLEVLRQLAVHYRPSGSLGIDGSHGVKRKAHPVQVLGARVIAQEAGRDLTGYDSATTLEARSHQLEVKAGGCAGENHLRWM